jgi:hypothetical protein
VQKVPSNQVDIFPAIGIIPQLFSAGDAKPA